MAIHNKRDISLYGEIYYYTIKECQGTQTIILYSWYRKFNWI